MRNSCIRSVELFLISNSTGPAGTLFLSMLRPIVPSLLFHNSTLTEGGSAADGEESGVVAANAVAASAAARDSTRQALIVCASLPTGKSYLFRATARSNSGRRVGNVG